ncbi:uncharacterized protein LOC143559769 [Bidens hawaiensis]|uniref:uncharacterized protein LOC143559769 n=1 Tax=Bidens hawaiensis TaxID=980011 RepID=UPI004048FA02
MLCDSKLPLFFWAEAVNTACYVQNRVIINKSKMKAPYEVVYGHQPTVAHFGAFGCPCTLLNLETTSNIGAAADECYFVGFNGGFRDLGGGEDDYVLPEVESKGFSVPSCQGVLEMADQNPLKIADSHNVPGYLFDPPLTHKEFNSIIVGLNTCRISHALQENPVICKKMITDFWNNSSINPHGQDGVISIDSKIQKKPVGITGAIVREVLMFGDQPDYPNEYSTAAVTEILTRMGYEGTYPPAIKKLFHPY